MTDEEVCAAAQAVIKVQAGKLIETIDRDAPRIMH